MTTHGAARVITCALTLRMITRHEAVLRSSKCSYQNNHQNRTPVDLAITKYLTFFLNKTAIWNNCMPSISFFAK